MKNILSYFFLLSACSLSYAQITISGNSTISGVNTFGIGGSGTVATPTMSQAAGAMTPGTATTPSDSTSGSTILYTWDGTTPAYTTQGGQLVPSGSTMVYNPTYYSGWPIYGAKTFKLLGVKTGMTDSSVASYAYTLTAASGTALSAPGTLAASTNYYLSSDISCTDICFTSAGAGWTLNLNGHTMTYGTAHTALVAATTGTTNGTTTLTCSGCGFTSGMVGDTIGVDDASLNNVLTTIATYVSSTQVTLTAAASWTSSGNNVWVWSGSAVFGIDCDGQYYSTCLNAKIYNGTITQASNIYPHSHAIQLGNPNQWGDNGNNIVSDVTMNVNSMEVHGISIAASPTTYGLGDLVQFNTINNTSIVIYNRDQLPGASIGISNTGPPTATSPVDVLTDNVFNGTPQGCIQAGATVNVINNHCLAGTTIEYVAGYGAFLARNSSVAWGNLATGWVRGYELEASNCTIAYNVGNTTDPAQIHDPHHNPLQCQGGGNDGFRVKNYSACGGANYTGNVVSNNMLTVTANACPAQGMRFSQMIAGDTGTISNNQLTLVMAAAPTPPSGAFSGDSGGPTCQEHMEGYTFSGNVTTVTGPYASYGFNISFDGGGASGWTIDNLAYPLIWGGAGSAEPSSGTFTGTGTATMHCVSGGGTMTVTYNGTTVPCT